MFNLESQLQQKLDDQIQNGNYVLNLMDSYLAQEPLQPFTGILRGSRLDWTQSPEQQLKNQLESGKPSPIELRRYAENGNILHEFIGKVLDETLGTSKWEEQQLKVEAMQISGTVDRLQFNVPNMGNVLFEFKTKSTFHRNKAEGDRLTKKFLNMCDKHLKLKDDNIKASQQMVVIEPDLVSIWEKIYKHLCISEQVIKADEKHLTQLFTYSYLLEYVYLTPVDYACLIYIHRDTMNTTEFWYKKDTHVFTKNMYRAYENLEAVRTCLNQYLNQI